MKPLDCFVRRDVLTRDKYQCQRCGNGNNLDVHHLIPENANGASVINNLVTLCRSCHRRVHVAMGQGVRIKGTQPITENRFVGSIRDYCFPVKMHKNGVITIPVEVRRSLNVIDGNVIEIKVAKTEKDATSDL